MARSSTGHNDLKTSMNVQISITDECTHVWFIQFIILSFLSLLIFMGVY